MKILREFAIGALCIGGYFGVRRLVWNERGQRRAARNADRVVALEERLGLRIEPGVQRAALRHQRLVDMLNVGYAVGNLTISVGWLILLHHRRSPVFVRERRAVVAAYLGALPVFLAFPAAPPRNRDDQVDTLLDRGIDLEHRMLVKLYNPIAAMPSHHVAFAVVTGFGMARFARSPLTRAVGTVYPATVATVVVATGNHYTLDVIAGAALGALARIATR
ncbi:MAG: phosphatase PAP2 family protein [Acidimicrobiaceae bacterium]|nr:phosphatase PAP2 family protein [Acidimicrobiaceae bacterium]